VMAYLDGGFHALAMWRSFSGGHNRERQVGCSREDDDDWTVGVACDCEPFPHHEGGREDQRKVERLGEDLSEQWSEVRGRCSGASGCG
jgi:hypothetical protein